MEVFRLNNITFDDDDDDDLGSVFQKAGLTKPKLT